MRQLGDELTKLLSIISHQSWLTREVPEDWRVPCEPIPKKGWKEDLGNSRPVSLTSVPSKVLEQITLRAITQHHRMAEGSDPASVDFSICIDDLDEGIESTISKFVDDTKLGESVDLLEGGRALHRDLDRLDPGPKSNSGRFKKPRARSCTLPQQPLQCYRLGTEWLESTRQKRTCSTDGQQAGHEPAVCPGGQEGQWHLAWIRNGVASRSRAVILPLCSALVDSTLSSVSSSWSPSLGRTWRGWSMSRERQQGW
ncbi:hypothetical protein DUI87_25748 [Hirundo rustica rustica]|uniref:Reverse transcriptase domain-containing protein n=1 Tax=Hirundo rustica rustica TaxID=333673 RepID=A0A3M0JG84_HIRRU|nr:hypothetical protein DUI87_25748 [Hirundo rustica rustica]